MAHNILLVFLFSVIVGGLSSIDISPRVYEGKEANIEDFPHTVTIYYNHKEYCGGAIISEDMILTAAHCLDQDISAYTISAGTDDCRPGNDVYRMEKMKIHEHFYNSPPNDLALVKLSTPLKFNSKIQPIKLASPDFKIPMGAEVRIAGCGNTYEVGHSKIYAERLWYTTLKVARCRDVDASFDYKDMFCSENVGDNSSPCHGDSGAGHVLDGRLVGIDIKGPNVCGETFAVGATEVSKHVDWIKDTVAKLRGTQPEVAED